MLGGRLFPYCEPGRVLEGTGEGDTRCLEGGRVFPLRILIGRTFSDGWMLWDDEGGLAGRGTGDGDGVARCLEGGLVYSLRILMGRIFSDG